MDQTGIEEEGIVDKDLWEPLHPGEVVDNFDMDSDNFDFHIDFDIVVAEAEVPVDYIDESEWVEEHLYKQVFEGQDCSQPDFRIESKRDPL